MISNKCAVCHRGVIAKGKRYCLYHSQAYDSLQKMYKAWVNAYGGVSRETYLKKLLDLDQTGDWVKHVIRFELKGPKAKRYEKERVNAQEQRIQKSPH